ncbi:MAG: rubrerythrin [Clostridiales bacterium]|nr:rubrerythrin [Clostridiales bacterium]
MNISGEDMKVLLKAQQGELDAVLMYNALADIVKDRKDADTFRQLASEEGRHASVFRELTNQVVKPKKTLATVVPLLYRIIGKKRLYPIIAKGEYDAVKTYAPVAEKFPEVESVKNDEHRHGDTVTELLKTQ